MNRRLLLCIAMGCSTPKVTDSGLEGHHGSQEGDGHAESNIDGGSGEFEDTGDDDESTDLGGLDQDDGGTDDDGTGDDGVSGEDGDSGALGGSGEDGSADDDDESIEDDEAVVSEVPVCLDDHLDFSVQITDDRGACASPCEAEDELSYHLTIENTTSADCVIHTPTACLIENTEISTLGVHGRVIETSVPSCDEALSTHHVFAGGMVNESLLGGRLSPGEYVVMINVDMDGGLAYGTATFNVE